MKYSVQRKGKKAQILRDLRKTAKSSYTYGLESNVKWPVSIQACKTGMRTKSGSERSSDYESEASAISEAIDILYESEIKDIRRFVKVSLRVKSLGD